LTTLRPAEVTKRDQSSTWRSANSIRSDVGFCSCCLTKTARTHQDSTATWRSRHRSDSQLPSPSPRRSPPAGESNYRKWQAAQSAQQRCADENVSVNTSANAHRHVCRRVHRHVLVRTLLCTRACVCKRVCKRGQHWRVHKCTTTRRKLILSGERCFALRYEMLF